MHTMKIFWLATFFSVLIWSGINPKDTFTWVLEVAPAIIGIFLLALTYKAFKLTTLLYCLILVHSIILMVGGHYTYAEVPLFDTIRDMFNLERNNYDKVGHFMQGFAPAILAREIIIRRQIINKPNWISIFVVSICLAFSAFYELLEWLVAIATGESAEAFLGTQGYVWDTQTDMAYALFGAILALILLSRLHNQQIINLRSMTKNIKINYLELPAEDLEKVKTFYANTFGWTFEDYGPDYAAFNDGSFDGGFYRAPLASNSDTGAALIVLYADDLEATQAVIEQNGGEIKKPIFSFPGGRRLHFLDPAQNELAVWTTT